MESFCQKCGNLYDTSKHHDCPADVSLAKSLLNDAPKQPPKSKAREKQQEIPESRQKYDPGAAERSKRWRENNPEAYREYKREYMKRYRRGKND